MRISRILDLTKNGWKNDRNYAIPVQCFNQLIDLQIRVAELQPEVHIHTVYTVCLPRLFKDKLSDKQSFFFQTPPQDSQIRPKVF